jgi:energy-converting hydrogenase Eha subunit A|tara:strand:+ start:901 stop:1161 length:261 start_codon:yes stop_codon:yes gene_type:complete
MPRIYLFSIILAVLLALIFGDTQFLFDTKPIIIWEKEISLNTQIIISGLTVLIILALLSLGIVEKIVSLFRESKRAEKKKEMAVKK